MDELTREFLIESQERLDRMERCLTELEERQNDAALLADIFRSVHTIKAARVRGSSVKVHGARKQTTPHPEESRARAGHRRSNDDQRDQLLPRRSPIRAAPH
jgi:chemotaxis protein histidine kinase CheA